MYRYKTHGTCSSFIEFDVKDNTLTAVKFIGGCAGNALGLSKLVVGMNIDEVISKLSGTPCGYKTTSCPDQLAQALTLYKQQNK